MLGENMIKLIEMLNENEWEYEISNGVFYMILGNGEEKFDTSNEDKAKELIENLNKWY